MRIRPKATHFFMCNHTSSNKELISNNGASKNISSNVKHILSAPAVDKSTAPKGIYGTYRLDVLVLNALTTIVVLTIATATTTAIYIISISMS